MLSDTNSAFDDLAKAVQSCVLCPSMSGCTRVFSHANGPIDAPLMFIGEAPGRLGADRTSIPFHGDVAGDNFELLLSTAGLSRRDVFVTNAVLCNPRDESGNNAPPSKSEVVNCAAHLRKQIDIIQPKLVMTLGRVALEATREVEHHDLVMSTHVRTENQWYGRVLIPLYHPGARAMMHRSRALQQSDYYFVAERLTRLGKPNRRTKISVRPSARGWPIVRYIVQKMHYISLFRLHKMIYLLDHGEVKRGREPMSGFFFIRQKDGPYCVELGGGWHRSEEKIKLKMKGGRPWLEWQALTLFEDSHSELPADIRLIIDNIIAEVSGLSDDQLKTKVYLTSQMRRLLRAERTGLNCLNKPLF